MLTSLGKYLRTMRIQKGELLKDMADKLDIAPAYLSSIENGKRSPSDKFISSVISAYNLSDNDADDLKSAYFDTLDEVVFSLSNMNNNQRSLGISFARELKSLDDDQISNIEKILKGANK